MNRQELLECIAPYLPYGLRCAMSGEHDENNNPIISTINEISKERDDRVWAGSITEEDYYSNLIEDVYPILRPLSDLTKPCLEGGKVPIEELVKMLFEGANVVRINNERIECLFEVKGERSTMWFNILHLGFNLYPFDIFDQFKAMQFMYKHHFDIFRLIEKGYAIDINTLK